MVLNVIVRVMWVVARTFKVVARVAIGSRRGVLLFLMAEPYDDTKYHRYHRGELYS